MTQATLEPTAAPEKPPSPSPRTLLLGLGNDILTDDAIGLYVVRELQLEFAGQPALDIRETTEMGLSLLDFITGYERVVIVDSIQTGNASPGFLHELKAEALTQLTGRTPHFLGVSETLALGRKLSLPMPEHVTLFAIEVEDPFSLGTSLTPTLEYALPGIVNQLRDTLSRLL